MRGRVQMALAVLALAVLALVALTLAETASAQDDPIGVVLATDHDPESGTAEAAAEAGGASWRVETLRPHPVRAAEPPLEALEAVEALYQEGDFPRCLTALTDPSLDLTRLLGQGYGAAAARLLTVSGACTVAAGDGGRGRELFQRAFVMELDVEEELARLRPDITAVAEEARRATVALERVPVTIDAPGAAIAVDGASSRCDRSPCVVQVFPGSHVISVSALGRARRVERVDVTGPVRLAPRLDLLSPEEAQAQLAGALHAGDSPETLGFAEAAANAFGARVLVLVTEDDDHVRAALFDRALGEVVAQQSTAARRGATPLLVGNVIEEWRGAIEPGIPWWVWAVVGGATVVAGVAAYLLIQPEVSSYSLRFEAN